MTNPKPEHAPERIPFIGMPDWQVTHDGDVYFKGERVGNLHVRYEESRGRLKIAGRYAVDLAHAHNAAMNGKPKAAPAAVSADIQSLAEELINFICKPARYPIDKEVVAMLEAYGDACRLDGARKCLSVVVPKAKKLRKLFHDRHVVYVDETDLADAKDIIDELRALSPETVCGGE